MSDSQNRQLVVGATAFVVGYLTHKVILIAHKRASESSSSSTSSSPSSISTANLDYSKSIGRRLARKTILALTPYRCARDDYEIGILLDANENTHGPTIPIDKPNPLHLERYPSPYQMELKGLVAKYRGCEKDQIFTGVGSDEAIDLLFRVFCEPGKDNVVVAPPTYGMYMVTAQVNDVAVKKVPLSPSFDLRVPEMLAAVDEHTKLMFVCSPGNPTAKSIPFEDIELLANSSYAGIIVVDEAYVDFSVNGSCIHLLKKYDNIVILQTLSKAFGLAGIRCGFAIGHTSVVQLMNNVKAPYNLSSLASNAAIEALNNVHVLEANVKLILGERSRVSDVLKTRPYVVRVCSSDSNFLLFELQKNAQKVYKTMADNGVVSRFRGNEMHCSECIRITVGKKEENEEFLRQLDIAWEQCL